MLQVWNTGAWINESTYTDVKGLMIFLYATLFFIPKIDSISLYDFSSRSLNLCMRVVKSDSIVPPMPAPGKLDLAPDFFQ